MERLELAISGAERALRPAPHGTPPVQGASAGRPSPTVAQPSWSVAMSQQLARVMEALGAEPTEAGECSLTATAARLSAERERLLRRLGQLAPVLADGCLDVGTDPDELRRTLERLLHDIAHHHQRVNDLVYDAGWRDVGGSG